LQQPIKVVDIFAGPGGLGEGFSSVTRKKKPAFELALSIEKDDVAHRTLMLRSFFRKFPFRAAPDAYYDYVSGEIDRTSLQADSRFKDHWEAAAQEARCITLGDSTHAKSDGLIRKAIGDAQDWVLIGGPPCQAYSLAGRSRRRPGDAEAFEADEKHFLYKEYLRILRLYKPAVFVMENVKGMLSSTHGGTRIFDRILGDLSAPSKDVEYDVCSLVTRGAGQALEPADFIIRSELYGIPQARHRVILLGVRKGFRTKRPNLLRPAKETISIGDVINDLPPLRSRISTGDQSHSIWLDVLERTRDELRKAKHQVDSDVLREIEKACSKASVRHSSGGLFTPIEKGNGAKPKCLPNWYHDPNLPGILQHEARSHMTSDLGRYLFLSSYGRVFGASPNLRAFPDALLPNHKNVDKENTPFLDRFRVQIESEPSTTVVSHISKDGHYYVHPDPSQCRSLTVREAARLQTFPDNYFFEGNRTQQYHQVGNAVPPLLAKRIGKIVLQLFLADGA